MTSTPIFTPTIQSQAYLDVYCNKKASEKSTNPNDEYADYSFNKPESNKARNILIGSLMALASLAVPSVIALEQDKSAFDNYSSSIVTNMNSQSETSGIECNPEALAKGGKDDSIVELREIMNLLDFKCLEGLPKSYAKSVASVALAQAIPVDINSEGAKEKIINQVKTLQKFIDKAANDYLENPSKSPYEQMIDYDNKYISPSEVLDRVDFSGLRKYQKDISVLRGLITYSVGRIGRRDADCAEKFEQEVAHAQSLVDNITKKYKLNSMVAGNYDYDGELTKKEILSLLNQDVLEGIPKDKQQEFLNNASQKYKTIYWGQVRDKKHYQNINKKVTKCVQEIQDKLDSQANNYRLNIYR